MSSNHLVNNSLNLLLSAIGISGLVAAAMQQSTPVDLLQLKNGFQLATSRIEINEINAIAPNSNNQASLFPVDISRFRVHLPSISLPEFSQSNEQLVWQLSETPCTSSEFGNHWSGQTGMYHCLVKEKVNHGS